jgi:hypothetical protein
MRVLVVSPSPPRPDGKGYAIRAAVMIQALERRHQLDVFVPSVSLIGRVADAVLDLITGRPAQVGWTMPRQAWRQVLGRADRVDLVLAVTVRSVRGPLPRPLVVDHVDALSANWARRATGPESWLHRRVARLEAGRLRRWEARVSRWASAHIVVSAQEAAALNSHPPAEVVAHISVVDEVAEVERDIDVVFTGNMRYPPNIQAARWLDREIATRLRQLHPEARIVVAGRAADRLELKQVETMSDVPSIPAVLARSRVAIVPMGDTGSGVPTKGLEAAACGSALVMTPWAHERLRLPARVADSADGLAHEVAALLDDEPARAALAAEARATIPVDPIGQLANRLDHIFAAVAGPPGAPA